MFETDVDFDFDDESLTSSFGSSEKPEKLTSSKRPLADRSNDDPGKKNKVEDSIHVRTRMAPRTAIKRKFPGPAGILPDCDGFDPSAMQNLGQQSGSTDGIPCTQSSLSVFEGGAWAQMTDDYPNLSSKFNIKWIKSQANANKLENQRAPFLGALIQEVKCFDAKHPIVNVVLKDMTGEVHGTIIHNLYEKYSSDLATGSAIVLKHFGVLTTGNKNNHHLTITHNNLAVIYSEIKSQDRDEVENTDKVKKIVMSELLDDEIALELIYYKEHEASMPAPATPSNRFQLRKFGDTSRKNEVLEGGGTSANRFHSNTDCQMKPADVSFWRKFSENSNRMPSAHSSNRPELPGCSGSEISNRTIFDRSGSSAGLVPSNIDQPVKQFDRSKFGGHSDERLAHPTNKPDSNDAPTKAIFETDADTLFDDNFQLRVPLVIQTDSSKKKFNFKSIKRGANCSSLLPSLVLPSDFGSDKMSDPSQHSTRTSSPSHHTDTRILQDALEGINADCLFDDF